MTGFIIFAIVLTLAYALYYAAMITTDLAAQKKAAQTEEETIDIGTETDDVDEFVTQHVVEDPNTGGFNFFVPERKLEDTTSEIAEAEESVEQQETDDDVETESENVETSDDESDKDVRQSEDGESEDSDLEGNEESEDSSESIEGVNTFTFSDDEPEPEKQNFNEEEAFDPSLRQTHFDVKTVYEPKASAAVSNHANMVNSSMESISTRGKGMICEDLRAAMRNHNNQPTNLELTDEWTKS